MGLRIQNNIEAFNAHRQLSSTSSQASKSMEKLSSGFRINRAADDAAGLAISEKMRGQIGGLAQAQRNAQDGISLVQTAEGSLAEVHSMLQRVRDLKVQHGNGTLSADDQSAIEAEIGQIGSEIKSIVENTKFNGTSLLNNATGFKFQVGANDNETISTGAVSLSGAVGSAGTRSPPANIRRPLATIAAQLCAAGSSSSRARVRPAWASDCWPSSQSTISPARAGAGRSGASADAPPRARAARSPTRRASCGP